MRIQLVLDTLADAEKVEVSDDEFGHEIVHRAQRANVPPQQYYDQLVQAGVAGAVFGEVRRAKALGLVMERIRIVDSAGTELSLAELRGPTSDEAEHDHSDEA